MGSLRVVTIVMVAMLLLLSGCESRVERPAQLRPKDAPIRAVKTRAEIEEERERARANAAWEATSRVADDPSRSRTERIAALRTFVSTFLRDPRALEARRKLRALDATPSIRAASRRLHAARLEGAGVLYRARLPDMSLRAMTQHITFELRALERPAFGKDAQALYTPVTLQRGDGATRTLPRPVELHHGAVIERAVSVFQRVWPRIAPACAVHRASCRRRVLDAVAREKLGAKLYLGVGRMDPNIVERLLRVITPRSPDSAFLGVTARAVYQAYRPAIARYLHVWKLLASDERKLLRAYRTTQRENTREPERARFLAFYYGVARNRRIASRVNRRMAVRGRTFEAHIPTGFWIRRMADGSAPVLIRRARRMLRAYDPPLYREIFDTSR